MKIVADYERKLINEDDDLEITFKVKGWNYKAFCNDLEKDTYTLDIKKLKSKRTLNQNNYLWKLIHDIGVEVNGHKSDDMELYVQLLEMAECKFEDVLIKEIAYDMLKGSFRACKVMGKVLINDDVMLRVRCFYGTSNFNVSEMKRLIDVTLDYASEVGVDTAFYRSVFYE